MIIYSTTNRHGALIFFSARRSSQYRMARRSPSADILMWIEHRNTMRSPSVWLSYAAAQWLIGVISGLSSFQTDCKESGKSLKGTVGKGPATPWAMHPSANAPVTMIFVSSFRMIGFRIHRPCPYDTILRINAMTRQCAPLWAAAPCRIKRARQPQSIKSSRQKSSAAFCKTRACLHI